MVDSGLVVCIPARNEESSVGRAVQEALSVSPFVLVLDDNSEDKTAEVASNAGASVITSQRVRRGYSSAVAQLISAAKTLGFKYAVTFDADGQHPVAALEKTAKLLLQGADFVVGCRTKLPRLGEKIFASVAGKRWGVSDPMSGLKGYTLANISTKSVYRDCVGTVAAGPLLRGKDSDSAYVEFSFSPPPRRSSESRYGHLISGNIKVLGALVIACIRYPAISRKA